MVECHAGLEIAPYISSAMRREILFSTSQKPRTGDGGVGGYEALGCREKERSYGRTELKTNDRVLNELVESRELLRSTKERKWRLIGHTSRHDDKLYHKIIEGKIASKRGRGKTCTLINGVISDAGLMRYMDPKRPVNNREELCDKTVQSTLWLITKEKNIN
ncbi:Hypothetical protein CINCED_3A002722 [Cinara cedri]|uniref:Uncharacterized protein n=1 Tax=Cinara cedri TaxID=506608 RepID=A0A5E4NQM7_9HEMI|nr:Hypothetical protein CINCED_3A002722 [Cinara cedri]